MINLHDFIRESPFVKKINVDELLFAEFKCPVEEGSSSIWWQNNFFAHILTGTTQLKTPRQEYTLRAGDSVFAKKGCIITRDHGEEDFCELLIFLPDDFIRTVITKYKIPLESLSPSNSSDTVIPLPADGRLQIYFQSLLGYFLPSAPPAGPLLKLKFEELLLSLLSGNSHASLQYYFSEVCRSTKPSIREIMEVNFFCNLTLNEFARLCSRSLSGFKKEFTLLYKTSPGKWLLKKRLEYGRYLLETTDHSIDEICLESGFENPSHFNRAFKNEYGLPPGKFKLEKTLSLQQH